MATITGNHHFHKENTMKRKRSVERKRVWLIGQEYHALSELVGLQHKKTNKVVILRAAVQFIKDHHEGLKLKMPNSPPASNSSQTAVKTEVEATPAIMKDTPPDMQSFQCQVMSSPLLAPSSANSMPMPGCTPSQSGEDNLLCLETVSYQDESEDESENSIPATAPPLLSLPSSQPRLVMVASGTNSSSSPTQYYNHMPLTPSSGVLFSPNNTPWLTSPSPQIFSSAFTSPLQPLQLQTTPKLHHLSPPISISTPVLSSMYSPEISVTNSPRYIPAYSIDQGQSELLQWEYTIHQ